MTEINCFDDIFNVLEKQTNISNDSIVEKYIALREFEIRDDDVFLLGFQKSGTTWAQEMVWLIANDLDYEAAKVFIDERVPVLELEINIKSYMKEEDLKYLPIPDCHINSVKFVREMKSPRLVKSHLASRMLPHQLLNGEKKAKIIYIARDFKDVCVSAYHYYKNLMKVTTASFDQFCKAFMNNSSPSGHYWETVLYFWNRRQEDNILFIKYEEMLGSLREIIRKVADFLGKSISTDQEDKLVEWLEFKNIKNNSAVNHENLYASNGFIRKGTAGEHKKEMSPEMISFIDSWINEAIKDTDYQI